MNSQDRLEKIKELIQENSLSDQLEIVELLDKKCHIKTNQAQVSRDLRKLGVIKRKSLHGDFYELPQLDVEKEILKLSVSSITHNEALIVIKTRAGLASFVGDYVDEHFHDFILGSIAGENTVFVTPTFTRDIVKLFEMLKQKLLF
jgi:transcriptional regulator of arginine metabolism